MQCAKADRVTRRISKHGSRLGESELIEVFLRASQFVIDCGFEGEIEWQRSRNLEQVTESEFLSQAAWVVLSSGMRESVIRSRFEYISESFHYWRDADKIRNDADSCRERALRHFGHAGKISAILSIISYVADSGIDDLKLKLRESGVEFLRNFAYMGPATAYHLAKNIGLQVVKPDRHLVRLSLVAGFDSPDGLCREISRHTGENVAVIDVILWRYATLRDDYLEAFATDESFLATVEC